MQTSQNATLVEIDGQAERSTAIKAIETRIVDCVTTRRHKLSNTEITHQSFVIVEVTLADGTTGYGEASTLGGPRWSEESVEAIKANIDTYIAPALLGQKATGIDRQQTQSEKSSARYGVAPIPLYQYQLILVQVSQYYDVLRRI